jgi:spermidine/putrescine transport system substrate-binding protein
LADDFLEFVQQPEICEAVAFSEGTYNPVAQMGNSEVMDRFDSEQLSAIQWETLSEEMERSVEYRVVASYSELSKIYSAVKRG